MFPSLAVQPDINGMLPLLTAYLVLAFSFFLNRFKNLVLGVCFFSALIFSVPTRAFIAMPGVCGSACMMQAQMWGYPQFGPAPYAYPYLPYPGYYPPPFAMLNPWDGRCLNCGVSLPFYPLRVIQSEEPEATKTKN